MKILIIKLAASGDVLRTTCILQGLREKYRDAEITWITEKYNMDLLKHNPYITTLLALEDARNSVGRKFDLIINLDEDKGACELASSFKGTIVGFYLEDGNILPTPTAKTWYDMSLLGKKPENDMLKKANTRTYQQLMLDILGLKPRKYDIILELDEESRKHAKNFADAHHFRSGPVIGLNTGAGRRWPMKSWPIEHTAALADKLAQESGATVILFGGPEEVERNRKIVELCTSKIVDAGCNNSLLDFAALIDLCDAVVTSDSLALHIAVALKKNVVVFFGVTSAAEIELYGRGTKLVASEKYLATYSTKADDGVMSGLGVDTVFAAIEDLIR